MTKQKKNGREKRIPPCTHVYNSNASLFNGDPIISTLRVARYVMKNFPLTDPTRLPVVFPYEAERFYLLSARQFRNTPESPVDA
jgi:hypothetical protein